MHQKREGSSKASSAFMMLLRMACNPGQETEEFMLQALRQDHAHC